MMETEVKIKVMNLEAVRAKLVGLGASVVRPAAVEDNRLFDFPGGPLTKSRRALRLRIVGRKAFLTFKGAPEPSRSFKVREEYETETKNPRQTLRILKSLGLRTVFAYRTLRERLRKGTLNISLDENEAGRFLEIEGKRSDITRLARALGYTRRDFVKADYVALLLAGKKPEEKK